MKDDSADEYQTRDGMTTRIEPRRDPVLHGAASPATPGPLTSDQLSQYARDGFLVLPAMLSRAEVGRLFGELRRLLAWVVGGPDEGVMRERDRPEVRSILRIHEQPGAFRRLAHDPRLVGAAQQILGDRVYVHQSRVNIKAGLADRGFPWHSDFETWHAEDGMPRMRALSAWVLLDDERSWNGPLLLLPGSHLSFVSCPTPTPPDHYPRAILQQKLGLPSARALRMLFGHAGRVEMATGPTGTVVLFDCNLLHACYDNLAPTSQRSVFIAYNSIENRLVAPFGAAAPRPAPFAERDPRPIE